MDAAVQRAREAVRVVYETPSDRGASEAARFLGDWGGGRPGGCEVAWALLDADAPGNTDNTRFWGANTLLHAMRSGRPSELGSRERLIEAAVHYARSGPLAVSTQLCSAAAALAMRGPQGAWPHVVASLVEGFPPAGDDDAHDYVLLRVLGSLPEELPTSDSGGGGEAAAAARAELVEGSAQVADALRSRMHVSERAFVQSARCLSSWLENGVMHVAEASDMLQMIIQGLSVEDETVFSAALDCVTAVATFAEPSVEAGSLVVPLAQFVAMVDTPLDTALTTAGPDAERRAAGLCNVVCRFVEANLTALLNPVTEGALDHLFQLLLLVQQCSCHPGQYPIDETVSDTALKLWHTLIFRLVESPHQSELRGPFTPCLVSLIPILRDKILLPPVGLLDADERRAFDQYRDEVGEAVGMVCFFVRRPAVESLRDLLAGDIAMLAATGQVEGGGGCEGGCGGTGLDGGGCGGCGAEATLALLAPAAALLPVCEADDVIEEILGTLSLLTSPSAALRAKARFVGHMAPWLGQRGPGFMQPAAEVVLGLLFQPGVTAAAADALAELCGYAPKDLLPALPVLCGGDLPRLLAGGAGGASGSVLRSVALLVQCLPPDDAASCLEQHVLPHVRQIEPLAAQCAAQGGGGDESSRDALLNTLRNTAVVIDALGDSCEGLAFQTFEVAWSGLRAVLRGMPGNEDAVELAAKCIGAAVDSCADTCRPVVHELVGECVACFETGHCASLLVILRRHVWSLVCRPGTCLETDALSRVTESMTMLLQSDDVMGHLDAVTAYFDLLSETFAIAGGLGCDGDDGEILLGRAIELALMTLRAIDRGVAKASAKFVARAVRSSGSPDGGARTTMRSALPSVLHAAVAGAAFDVDRSVLGDLGAVVDACRERYPDLFAESLVRVLEEVETPHDARAALAADLLDAPRTYIGAQDAIIAFADRTRREASAADA